MFQAAIGQKVLITLSAVDAQGNPTTMPAGVPTWASAVAGDTITPDPTGLTAVLMPTVTGSVVVSAAVAGISGSVTIPVVAGQAVSLVLTPSLSA